MQTVTKTHTCVMVIVLLAGIGVAHAKYAGGEHWWEFYGTPFTGTFDGRGYAISHLTIAGKGYLGLFGKSGPGSTISNLALYAVAVNGTGAHVAGLAGSNAGTITGCSSFGAITGGEYYVGGLVGENDGSITASQTAGVVKGQYDVGGSQARTAPVPASPRATVPVQSTAAVVSAVWSAWPTVGSPAATAPVPFPAMGLSAGCWDRVRIWSPSPAATAPVPSAATSGVPVGWQAISISAT